MGSTVEQNQIKSRNKPRINKNSKKAKKVNLISNDELPKSDNAISPFNESKMSYSSVAKSNIVKESKPLLPTKSQPKMDPVQVTKPLTTNPPLESFQSSAVDDSDKWEKVPLSITKDENWEKTSKKRKNRKKKMRRRNKEGERRSKAVKIQRRILVAEL